MIIIIICLVYLVGVIAALASIAFINTINPNRGIDDYTDPSLALLSWIIVLGVLACIIITFTPMLTNKLFEPIYNWFYKKFKKWNY